MNLLEDPLLAVRDGVWVSLPNLLALMARGEPCSFPSLRPHQRPAWHMFLVQLSALALWTNERDDLPADEESWKQCLRVLTPDHPADEPWRLVVDEDKPAFFQSPVPVGDQGLKWSPVATPDDLDTLITSRNHDLKQHMARRSMPEDWIFALVSAQTTDGYGGRGHQGVARMNGGSSSRPMVGLAPSGKTNLSVDASAWWARDVLVLMEARRAKPGAGSPGVVGGQSLLWCLDWSEGDQLALRDLDPWFIEVCRRIRLKGNADGLSAQRSTSAKTRVDAKAFKGNVGDPWSPVHKPSGKSFTLTSRGYDYKALYDLLFSGDWEPPLLAKESSEKTDMLLVAEGISRGNSKTEGYHSRILPVPRNVLPFFSSEDVGRLSKAQIEEIRKFDAILRHALALVAANGERGGVRREHFAWASQASARFDRVADALFFPSLWKRVQVAGATDFKAQRGKTDFLQNLRNAAEREFELAMPSIPCAAIRRPRAEARARRMFHGRIRREFDELFERGSADATR